jgi:hypothetical protein
MLLVIMPQFCIALKQLVDRWKRQFVVFVDMASETRELAPSEVALRFELCLWTQLAIFDFASKWPSKALELGVGDAIDNSLKDRNFHAAFKLDLEFRQSSQNDLHVLCLLAMVVELDLWKHNMTGVFCRILGRQHYRFWVTCVPAQMIR